MTYYDSAEDLTITRERAQQEVRTHLATRDAFDATWLDFTTDHGDCETYEAQTVLAWLGY